MPTERDITHQSRCRWTTMCQKGRHPPCSVAGQSPCFAVGRSLWYRVSQICGPVGGNAHAHQCSVAAAAAAAGQIPRRRHQTGRRPPAAAGCCSVPKSNRTWCRMWRRGKLGVADGGRALRSRCEQQSLRNQLIEALDKRHGAAESDTRSVETDARAGGEMQML